MCFRVSYFFMFYVYSYVYDYVYYYYFYCFTYCVLLLFYILILVLSYTSFVKPSLYLLTLYSLSPSRSPPTSSSNTIRISPIFLPILTTFSNPPTKLSIMKTFSRILSYLCRQLIQCNGYYSYLFMMPIIVFIFVFIFNMVVFVSMFVSVVVVVLVADDLDGFFNMKGRK